MNILYEVAPFDIVRNKEKSVFVRSENQYAEWLCNFALTLHGIMS